MGTMAKLDEVVKVRAADPLHSRCDHAHQKLQKGDSGMYYVCQGCGAFIDYSKPGRPENLDVA